MTPWTLPLGKYTGKQLSEVPTSYLQWLLNPVLKSGDRFEVPAEIREKVREHLGINDTAWERFTGKSGHKTTYVVERQGLDETYHEFDTLEAALAHIANTHATLDIEDDMVLVWEVLASGHRKVAWYFCGYAWTDMQFHGLQQGCLPGQTLSLFDILNEVTIHTP